MISENRKQAYWRANTALIRTLLLIWAVTSIGLSILFVQPLNSLKLGNLPLGFWMAQQGSIYIFVALIFIYARQMDKLDRKYLRNAPVESPENRFDRAR
jgi:putative solute:sodium symporter small subunit